MPKFQKDLDGEKGCAGADGNIRGNAAAFLFPLVIFFNCKALIIYTSWRV
jgi:hypothetical protein